jgi:hypothetical protein
MALRRQTATMNGDCMERILVIPPGGDEWLAHPTRGWWKPCGTYPPIRTTYGGGSTGFGKDVSSKSAINMGGSVFTKTENLVRYAGTYETGDGIIYTGNLGTGDMTSAETDKFKKLGLMVLLFIGGYFVIKKFL